MHSAPRRLLVASFLIALAPEVLAAPPAPPLSLDDEMRELTYIGYEETETTARVLVRTTEPVRWHMDTATPGLVVVSLAHTRIERPAMRRALDTRFFAGPITSVTAQAIEGPSASVRIVIACDAPGEARVQQQALALDIEIPK